MNERPIWERFRQLAHRAAFALVVGGAWGVPASVTACPVCFVAEQRSLAAYLATTVLLSLLPFALFALIAVVWRREQRLAARRQGPEAQRLG